MTFKSTFYFLLFIPFSFSANAQWEQVTSMPEDFRTHHSFGFGIDDVGYVVTGTEFSSAGSQPSKRFYSYNPEKNEWTQKEDFPGPARSYGIGEVYDGKAYFGFGLNDVVLNDLWVYDPVSDNWSELPSCPCDPRWHPGFTISNGLIIVGMGLSDLGNRKDFWLYEIETKEWTQIADYPSDIRHHPYHFSIGDFHYVGLGHGPELYKEWYRYDASADTWEEMAELPGEGRVAGTQFSWGGKGFVLSGNGEDHESMDTGEFYMYDPELNAWEELTPHPGTSRWAPASFILNDEVYIINGLTLVPDLGYRPVDEVYKYPLNPVSNVVEAEEIDFEIYPNPASGFIHIETDSKFESTDMVEITDVAGKVVMRTAAKQLIQVSSLSKGVYQLSLTKGNAKSTKQFVKL